MKRLIKIFIIWLIATTLPVQGVASVAMMNCVQTTHEHQQGITAEHDHAMQHDDSAHAHTHDTAKLNNHESHAKANATHACAHCVKCTNCCSGFTFQSMATDLFQKLSVSEAKFNDHRLLFKGFIPSGLERPPRPSLV